MRTGRWDKAKTQLAIEKIRAEMISSPPAAGKYLEVFQTKVEERVPEEWQGLALLGFNMGFQFGVILNNANKAKLAQDRLLCLIGLGLLLVGVALFFLKNSMTGAQEVVCCVLTALGSSAFLVFLPGLLEMNGVMAPNHFFHSVKVKATGAAGIFIIVFILMRVAIQFSGK